MTHKFFAFSMTPSVVSRSFFRCLIQVVESLRLRSRSKFRVSLRASSASISPPMAPRPRPISKKENLDYLIGSTCTYLSWVTLTLTQSALPVDHFAGY